MFKTIVFISDFYVVGIKLFRTWTVNINYMKIDHQFKAFLAVKINLWSESEVGSLQLITTIRSHEQNQFGFF